MLIRERQRMITMRQLPYKGVTDRWQHIRIASCIKNGRNTFLVIGKITKRRTVDTAAICKTHTALVIELISIGKM